MTAHATSRLPIVTDSAGHAYLGADAVVELLRAIAESCRILADNLDCRAIMKTAILTKEP